MTVVRTEPAGHPGGVHGRVATAVHRDPAADHRPAAGGDRVQERHRVDDPAGVPGRDVDPLGQVRTDGHEGAVSCSMPIVGGRLAAFVGRTAADNLVAEHASAGRWLATRTG
jgi:hypothetical protein